MVRSSNTEAEVTRVVAEGVVARGEEIYISYGNHPNDVLLTECESP